jgi:CheY-like chemotaxis protein
MSQTDPLSVLLIEDDPDARNLFQLVMDHHHHLLEAVSNAESALEYLATHAPDVIVMDIYLPGIDGYQALKQIRQQQLAPTSAVVATTAYYNSETETDILARGFNGYLQKPFNPQTLGSYLEQLVRQG